MKHRSAFVIFTCIQVAARRRHVNARDRQDYFILQGLKEFGMRQTCPKTFWKNLRLSVERDPCRMPLALTLQRKNQKAFCVERSYKWNDYGTKEHRVRILLRNNKRSRQVDELCNLCCRQRWEWHQSIYEIVVEIYQSEGSIKAIALAQLWKCTSAAEVHSRSDVYV